MKRSISFFSILLFAILCAACTGEIEPSPAELPVAITSPDFTSTSGPSATPTPTPTPLPPVFVRVGTPPIQPQEPISVDNASRIQELARWGYGAINEVEHSKDGQLMFVQTSIGVYAYHAGTLDEVWRYEVDSGASSFDVGSQYLVVGTFSGEIILLDASDGSEVYAWEGHNEGVLDVTLSPDETMVASGSYDETMKLWQVDAVPEISLLYQIQMDERVRWVSFADAGRLIIACKNYAGMCSVIETDGGKVIRYIDGLISVEHDIYIWEEKIRRITTNELILEANFFELEGESFWPTSHAISNNGNFFAVGGAGDDFDILLWDLVDGSLLKKFYIAPIMSLSTRHLARPAMRSGPGPYGLFSLDFSSDDRYLLAVNGLGNIFLWDLKTQALRTITKSGYQNALFSPDGQLVISYSKDNIAILSISSGVQLDFISEGWYSQNDYSDFGEDLYFSPDNHLLANGSRLWVIEDGDRKGLPWEEKVLGFSENGQSIYTLRKQWWVAQRSTDGLKLIKQIQLERPRKDSGNYWFNTDLAWWELGSWRMSPDGEIIRSGSYETPYLVWNVDTGKFVRFVGGSTFHRSEFSSDGHYLAEERNCNVVIREQQTDGVYEEILLIIVGDKGMYCPNDYVFSPSNQLYFASDKTIEVFDLTKNDWEKSFYLGSENSGRRLTVSPDESLLAVTSGKKISIWDINEENLLVEFDAHLLDILDITFSPDGRYLATTSWDGTVRLWGIVP